VASPRNGTWSVDVEGSSESREVATLRGVVIAVVREAFIVVHLKECGVGEAYLPASDC